jgi:hypothetical protein
MLPIEDWMPAAIDTAAIPAGVNPITIVRPKDAADVTATKMMLPIAWFCLVVWRVNEIQITPT